MIDSGYWLLVSAYLFLRDFSIERGESGTLKKDIAEIERKLKALIKSLEKNLDPGILGPFSPTKLEKNQYFVRYYHFAKHTISCAY